MLVYVKEGCPMTKFSVLRKSLKIISYSKTLRLWGNQKSHQISQVIFRMLIFLQLSNSDLLYIKVYWRLGAQYLWKAWVPILYVSCMSAIAQQISGSIFPYTLLPKWLMITCLCMCASSVYVHDFVDQKTGPDKENDLHRY